MFAFSSRLQTPCGRNTPEGTRCLGDIDAFRSNGARGLFPKHRILAVEDESFLALEREEILTEPGAVAIDSTADLATALAQVRADGLDAAILDINLGGELSYPLADALAAQRVQFMFASAYSPSEIPARFSDRPLVEKPFSKNSILYAVVDLSERT